MRTVRRLLSVAICLLSCSPLHAHYHLLLASSASGDAEKPIRLTWTFGHPFEHEFSAVQKPNKLIVLAPDGTSSDLLNQIQAEKKGETTSYTVSFTPPRRGDYVFWAEAAPVTLESEKVIYQDSVKLVYHALQAQRGWDHNIGSGLELVPLTRPYGLEPGLVFQSQALLSGKPQPGALVDVERYNPDPPKREDLPADEQITRQMKTDPNGIATCTLPDPGWWVITVTMDGGTEKRDAREFKIKKRSTLLVFVENKAKK
jgi:cobalt/nickel transport protein